MKKLILLSTFFFSICTNALPNCPLDQSLRYDNCYGTYTYSDGSEYFGEWKDGERHGQGTLTWADGHEYDGDKYVGEWKDDNRNGLGTYIWANGDKYVGAKDNKVNGQGTITWAQETNTSGHGKTTK